MSNSQNASPKHTSPVLDEKLLQLTAKLPNEMYPKRDLWEGIEQQISRPAQLGHRQQRPNLQKKSSALLLPPLFALPALALVALIGVMILWNGDLQHHDAFPLNESKLSLVMQMNQDFAAQKTQLLQYVSEQPAFSDNWQTQLNELERAAEILTDAINQDPNNKVLVRMLNNVHQQQIDLIEKVHAPKWQRI